VTSDLVNEKELPSARRMVRARTQLVLKEPFWGMLAMQLTIHKVKPEQMGWMPTMLTDGKHILYTEEFIDLFNGDELQTIVGHEVCHCVLGHPFRAQDRHPMIWNIAIDMVTNQILKDSGFTLPEGCVQPIDELKTASAERIYAWLLKNSPPAKTGCSGDGDEAGQGQPRGGVGGCQTPFGKLLDDHGKWGKKKPNQSNAEARTELEQMEAEWKANVAKAAAAARAQQRGNLPAGLERLIGQLLAPKLDWRTILAQFMVSLSLDDYSYTRVRKAYVKNARAAYMARLHSERVNLAVAIDTSGSISAKMIDNFLSEVTGMLWANNGATLTLYACDAEVHAVWRLKPNDPLPNALPGGGGTDFRPVFKRIAEEDYPDEPPDALVYLTDSYGAFPEDPPEYPVLWIVDAPPETVEIPFGEVVEYIDEGTDRAFGP